MMAQNPATAIPVDAGETPPFHLVIRRAHLFDGYKVIDGLRDIGINGGQIAAVSAEPLDGRKAIDAAGGWVMPGMIDAHVHFYDVFGVTDPASMEHFEEKEVPGLLQLFLEHGVTTLKSVGDPTGGILDIRARIAAGTLRGPRMLVTGCGITGRDGHPASTIFRSNPWARAQATGEVETVQQMRDLVHFLADRKVDAIKLLSEGACACSGTEKYIWQIPVLPTPVELVRLPVDLLRAGVEAAHDRGLRVTVHTAQQAAVREALEAGADALEHGITVEPITDNSLIDLMLEHDITYVPTLWIKGQFYPEAKRNLKRVADAGVRIALGSDTFGGGPGLFAANSLREAELMVEAGMSPIQSLKAGTSVAAQHCARADLGVIAPGKRADLVLLSADPTQDISNIRKLSVTILNGEIVVDKR